MKFKLTRDVTVAECQWLSRPFKKGEVVSRFDGPTYDCIGTGVACSEDVGNPFFELPSDALEPLTGDLGKDA